MLRRRLPVARAVLIAMVSMGACRKPNPDFVDTAGSESGDTAGESTTGESTTGGCADDTGGPGTEVDPIDLGMVEVGAPPGVAQGIVTPELDTWWFTFVHRQTSGSDRINVVLEAATSPELCVFVECVDAPAIPVLLCDGGAPLQSSPLGRAGCCGQGSVGLFHACTDEVLVVLRVEDETTDACVPFDLVYRVTEIGG